uniref:Invertebrate defensins family profile domain-containing protein n=1 Tax=Strigamia maritima TaxID=126957 RepID=T1IYA0_STRMM
MKTQLALILSLCFVFGVLAKDPCEVGSTLSCQIHCLIQGGMFGTCGPENICKCGSYYENSDTKVDPNKQPCLTGASLGCTIHCITSGSFFGHCDAEDNCVCL